jgi:hypothetical protein
LCVTNDAITRLPRDCSGTRQVRAARLPVADAGEEDESFKEGSIADGERGQGATIYLDFLDKGSRSDKRNVLAQHLREVIDVLEQRVRKLHHFNLKRHLSISETEDHRASSAASAVPSQKPKV